MLTPSLERALIRGNANYRTHIHAIGAVSKILVPTNHIAIIIDFTVFPHCDNSTGSAYQNAGLDDLTSVHVIDFFSRGKRCSYLYKNNFEILVNPKDENEYYIKNSEPQKNDCFQIHKQDIYLSIANISGVHNYKTITFSTLVKSQNEVVPAGYGTTEILAQKTLLKLELESGTIYLPCGQIEANEVNNILNNTQPYGQIGGGFSELPDPSIDAINSVVPFVNVNYIEINNNNIKQLLR